MGVINFFRQQYGQTPLEIEPRLAKYVNLAINNKPLDIKLQGLITIQHSALVDEFTGQTAPSFIKSWIRDSYTLNALLSPANKGYIEFVEQPDESKKVVFINVLTFN